MLQMTAFYTLINPILYIEFGLILILDIIILNKIINQPSSFMLRALVTFGENSKSINLMNKMTMLAQPPIQTHNKKPMPQQICSPNTSQPTLQQVLEVSPLHSVKKKLIK